MTGGHDALERLLAETGDAEAVPAETVVAAALAARRPGRSIDVERPASPLEVFRDRVADFAAAVAGVPPDGWGRPALPYPWTVHQLVAHLAAIEAYVAHLLGIPGFDAPQGPELDHLAMTEPAVQAAAGVAPEHTVAAWREAADRVIEHLEQAGPAAMEERVAFHGIDLSVRSLLVIRGFELWTHADDVRRAVGRPVVDPPADVVHTMSALSVGALPLLVAPAHAATVRLVLIGPGGGSWTVRLGAPADEMSEPDVEVVASAVDWCRMASRRIEADALDATIDGDGHLARSVFAAAQALAF